MLLINQQLKVMSNMLPPGNYPTLAVSAPSTARAIPDM